MHPLISIIVPVYNGESYLENCLDSILAQRYPNIEMIVVDDGSTDHSGVIADAYADRNPQRVRCMHTENCGVSSARLTGVRAASGDWIGFVDCDDEIEPDMYERLMENALRERADISHCGYQTIVNGGERIHYFHNTGKRIRQDHLTGLRDLLDGSMVEPGLWSKIYRRSLFYDMLQSDLVDTTIRYTEDLLMNYYLFKAAESAIFEDFCPYRYLVRSTSATRKQPEPETLRRRALDPMKVRHMIYRDVEPELKELCENSLVMSLLAAYLYLLDQKEDQKERDSIRQELRQHRNAVKRLRQVDRVRYYMILATPRLYRKAYSFYEKHFQRKVYE